MLTERNKCNLSLSKCGQQLASFIAFFMYLGSVKADTTWKATSLWYNVIANIVTLYTGVSAIIVIMARGWDSCSTRKSRVATTKTQV